MPAMPRDDLAPDPAAVTRRRRPARAFALALGVALASGVAVAAWSAAQGLSPAAQALSHAPGGPLLARGERLDHLLDRADASPTQRAQAHQILDAADADLGAQRVAERAEHLRLVQLFAQPTIDAAAVQAVRARIEQRHDAQSRRATQALIDVGLVLTPQQRSTIASQLADGTPPFAAILHPTAVRTAMNQETPSR